MTNPKTAATHRVAAMLRYLKDATPDTFDGFARMTQDAALDLYTIAMQYAADGDMESAGEVLYQYEVQSYIAADLTEMAKVLRNIDAMEEAH